MYHLSKIRLPKGGPLIFVLSTFLITLAMPLIAPVFPMYTKTFVKTDAMVGYLTAFLMFLYLVSNLFVGKLLERFSRVRLLMISTLVYSATLMILLYISNVYEFIALAVFRSISLVAIVITIGLLVRENSERSKLGKVEGWFYVVSNSAWMIGPLIGGYIALKFDYAGVFLVAALFPLLFFFLLFSEKLREKRIIIKHEHSWNAIKEFFKRKDMRVVYLLSAGIMLWWGFIYTFVPLYLTEHAYNPAEIGYVLFALVIPLILLEMPVGRWADRKGCRRFLTLGFSIMGIFALLAFFSSVGMSVWFIILASFGAAFIEPLLEFFFFTKLNDRDEVRFYPVYKTSIDFGKIVGMIIFSSLLLFFSFKSLFLFLGTALALFAIAAYVFVRD
ncbi:MAG: MFS transporter [archaeon]